METIIRPTRNTLSINIPELWQYRELFYVFVWRDIKIRYKQTLIGIGWVLFQPIVTTGIFSVFFGKIAKIPSDGLPYPLFVLIGLTFWNFFSNGVLRASDSMIGNEGIIKKVYFPRLIIPLASILTVAVDFALTLFLTIIIGVIYGFYPNLTLILTFPIVLITLTLTTGGLGLFASALNISFRDVRHILPFFVQVGLFVTPVIYSLSAIYDFRRTILMLNPLSSVIETYRLSLVGGPISWGLIITGLLVALLAFITGLFYFNKSESFLADVL